MTCDERIEAPLNRAGQTIADLPDAYSYDEMIKAAETLTAYLAKLYPDDPIRNEPENFLWYILHLTDIIDRMETALENVCGQRDYLTAKYAPGPCEPVPEDWKIPEDEYD